MKREAKGKIVPNFHEQRKQKYGNASGKPPRKARAPVILLSKAQRASDYWGVLVDFDMWRVIVIDEPAPRYILFTGRTVGGRLDRQGTFADAAALRAAVVGHRFLRAPLVVWNEVSEFPDNPAAAAAALRPAASG
jgi:hypothetical protein